MNKKRIIYFFNFILIILTAFIIGNQIYAGYNANTQIYYFSFNNTYDGFTTQSSPMGFLTSSSWCYSQASVDSLDTYGSLYRSFGSNPWTSYDSIQWIYRVYCTKSGDGNAYVNIDDDGGGYNDYALGTSTWTTRSINRPDTSDFISFRVTEGGDWSYGQARLYVDYLYIYGVDNTQPTYSGPTITIYPISGRMYKTGTTVYYTTYGGDPGDFTISGTAADTGGSGVASIDFSTMFGKSGLDTSSPYSVNYNISSSDSASYANRSVTVYDRVNNSRVYTSQFSIYYDDSGPNPPTITSPSSGSWFATDPNIVWGDSSGDNGPNGGAGVLNDNFDINYNDGSDNIVNRSVKNYTIPAPAAFTVYTVSVRAYDRIGNPGSWSSSIIVNVDKQDPIITSMTCIYTHYSAGNVGWYTAADSYGIRIHYNEENCNVSPGSLVFSGPNSDWSKTVNTPTGGTSVSADYTFSHTLNLAHGVYNITAQITDRVNNVGSLSVPIFAVDTEKPVITFNATTISLNNNTLSSNFIYLESNQVIWYNEGFEGLGAATAPSIGFTINAVPNDDGASPDGADSGIYKLDFPALGDTTGSTLYSIWSKQYLVSGSTGGSDLNQKIIAHDHVTNKGTNTVSLRADNTPSGKPTWNYVPAYTNTVILNWSAPSVTDPNSDGDFITGYNIYRKKSTDISSGDMSFEQDSTAICIATNVSGPTWTDTYLASDGSDDDSYYYVIRACDRVHNESAYSVGDSKHIIYDTKPPTISPITTSDFQNCPYIKASPQTIYYSPTIQGVIQVKSYFSDPTPGPHIQELRGRIVGYASSEVTNHLNMSDTSSIISIPITGISVSGDVILELTIVDRGGNTDTETITIRIDNDVPSCKINLVKDPRDNSIILKGGWDDKRAPLIENFYDNDDIMASTNSLADFIKVTISDTNDNAGGSGVLSGAAVQFLRSTSASTPSVNDPNWNNTWKPTTITFPNNPTLTNFGCTEGTNYLFVKIQDRCSNVSIFRTNVICDLTPPTTNIDVIITNEVIPAAGAPADELDHYVASNTIIARWTIGTPDTHFYRYYRVCSKERFPDISMGSLTWTTNDTATFQIWNGLADSGKSEYYYVYVFAVDKAGNMSYRITRTNANPPGLDYTKIDLIPPVIDIISPTPDTPFDWASSNIPVTVNIVDYNFYKLGWAIKPTHRFMLPYSSVDASGTKYAENTTNQSFTITNRWFSSTITNNDITKGDGYCTLVVYATDVSRRVATNFVEFYFDNKAPELTIKSLIPDNDNFGSSYALCRFNTNLNKLYYNSDDSSASYPVSYSLSVEVRNIQVNRDGGTEPSSEIQYVYFPAVFSGDVNSYVTVPNEGFYQNQHSFGFGDNENGAFNIIVKDVAGNFNTNSYFVEKDNASPHFPKIYCTYTTNSNASPFQVSSNFTLVLTMLSDVSGVAHVWYGYDNIVNATNRYPFTKEFDNVYQATQLVSITAVNQVTNGSSIAHGQGQVIWIYLEDGVGNHEKAATNITKYTLYWDSEPPERPRLMPIPEFTSSDTNRLVCTSPVVDYGYGMDVFYRFQCIDGRKWVPNSDPTNGDGGIVMSSYLHSSGGDSDWHKDLDGTVDYVFTNLEDGVKYYFRVVAQDALSNANTWADNNTYSNYRYTWKDDSVPAATVIDEPLFTRGSTNTVYWRNTVDINANNSMDPCSGMQALPYFVEMATNPNFATIVDSSTSYISETNFNFSGLNNGIQYFFRIRTIDNVNNIAYSAIFDTMQDSVYPYPVTNIGLSIVSNVGDIVITWSDPKDPLEDVTNVRGKIRGSGVKYYYIYRSSWISSSKATPYISSYDTTNFHLLDIITNDSSTNFVYTNKFHASGLLPSEKWRYLTDGKYYEYYILVADAVMNTNTSIHPNGIVCDNGPPHLVKFWTSDPVPVNNTLGGTAQGIGEDDYLTFWIQFHEDINTNAAVISLGSAKWRTKGAVQDQVFDLVLIGITNSQDYLSDILVFKATNNILDGTNIGFAGPYDTQNAYISIRDFKDYVGNYMLPQFDYKVDPANGPANTNFTFQIDTKEPYILDTFPRLATNPDSSTNMYVLNIDTIICMFDDEMQLSSFRNDGLYITDHLGKTVEGSFTNMHFGTNIVFKASDVLKYCELYSLHLDSTKILDDASNFLVDDHVYYFKTLLDCPSLGSKAVLSSDNGRLQAEFYNYSYASPIYVDISPVIITDYHPMAVPSKTPALSATDPDLIEKVELANMNTMYQEKLVYLLLPSAWEYPMAVTVNDANDNRITKGFGGYSLIFSYSETNTGLVTVYNDTRYEGMSEDFIAPFILDEDNDYPRWNFLADSIVNIKNNTVRIDKLRKAGVFTLMIFKKPENLNDSFSVYPNPFNPDRDGELTIEYYLEESDTVNLCIYTITGVLVKEYYFDEADLSGYTSKGINNNVKWDGKNEKNMDVEDGIYIVVITTGDGEEKAKEKIAVIHY